MTLDVGGAFLNADMPDTGPKVHVRIDGPAAQILADMDPTHKAHLDERGTIIVQLRKALYGTVQASKLWYQTLSLKLSELGYQKNAYDPCVFNKTVEGHQVTIALHVDDMFVTSVNREDLDEIGRAHV